MDGPAVLLMLLLVLLWCMVMMVWVLLWWLLLWGWMAVHVVSLLSLCATLSLSLCATSSQRVPVVVA